MIKKLCLCEKDIEELYTTCLAAKKFAVDTETVSLEDMTMIGMSVATDNNSWYIPVSKLPVSIFKKPIKLLLESDELIKILHNAKFDIKVFKKIGIGINRFYDTMVMAWISDVGKGVKLRFGLKELASRVLDYKMVKYTEVDQDNLEAFADYAMEDTIYTYKLFDYYLPKLTKKQKLFLKRYEMPCVKMLADMESHGIEVDVMKMKNLNSYLKREVDRLKLELINKTVQDGFIPTAKPKKKGEIVVFNPNSSKQVVEYLNFIGIDTETSDKRIIGTYAKKYPWVATKLEYAKLKTLYSSFVNNLLPKILADNGRLHGEFKQIGTETGRFASASPNLQNLPSHDEFHYRSIFVAPQGKKLIVADYSQMELRVLGHFSGDKQLIKFFMNNYDIHAATAHAMYKLDCSVEEVKEKYPDYRFKAKSINFGLMYGRGPWSLAAELNVTPDEAKDIIRVYFSQFPSVERFIHQVQKFALENHYTEMISGRRRHFYQLKELNRIRDQAERKRLIGEVNRRAINTLIQGSSADIMKVAMVNIWDELNRLGGEAKLLIQVHDEVVLEVPEEKADFYCNLVKDRMENAVKLKVPLVADAKIASNWEEGK